MIDVFPVIIYFHRLLRIVILPDKLKGDGVQDPGNFRLVLKEEESNQKKPALFRWRVSKLELEMG
ncbi:hypothetical protein LEP1GSC188_4208 [Leptospira weilii serovar Topaz str. LT2116]|uniref:Uncharacterized protein n=1 Tax=Leptospira weilii serovar Topaz str. LT2116 TaxID=1088540 RepID=M3FUA9_9LEPT|nr:hypothetical protein LEP1GSC188_4208 [Leptospira weilii serovar Topaz str. LT2116]